MRQRVPSHFNCSLPKTRLAYFHIHHTGASGVLCVVGVVQTVVQMCCPQRLEVNTEKTCHLFMSREHDTRQNHNIKAANISFENLAK